MIETYSFGYWVLRRRKALDLTREELARRVGCAIETIKKIERDERRPSRQVAELLADALAIPPEEQTLFLQAARGERSVERLNMVSQSVALIRSPRHNLPVQSTSFIGRQDQIADLKARMGDPHYRLCTVLGPGGIGKTRLARQVAAQFLDTYSDGVWLVELASTSDPALVPQTVITTLGLIRQASRSPFTGLIDFLEAKRALLVLDSCEHLIDACAQLAETLLSTCLGVRILATSREALGIPGEVVYFLSPLTTPDPSALSLDTLCENEAVQLFVDRAQTAMRGFTITADNAPFIVQVCQQLDGIPLALELAAARVRMLRVEQIALRLEDRFSLLTGGARTALPRHQTLQATIDWSYDLLSEPERVLLRRVSVFAGGWSLEAAECICGDENIETHKILNLLTQLTNKSLILAERKQGQETRYRMLETIRQYAREKLFESGEGERIKSRHLEYFVDLVGEAEPKMHSAEQWVWFNRLESEHDNLRTALKWAVEHNRIELGLRLGGALYPFWDSRRVWFEGYEHLVSLLKNQTAIKAAVRAKALVTTGYFADRCGYSTEMYSLFEEGIQIIRKLGEEGKPLLGFALALYAFAFLDRDLVRALSLAEESIKTSRAAGDPLSLAYSLLYYGMITRRLSDFAAARSAQEESLTLFEQMGDQRMYAVLLDKLGWTHHWDGNLQQAAECFNQSAKIAREIGDKTSEAISTSGRGDIARRLGNYEEASALLQRSLALFREIGTELQGLVNTLNYLGLLELTRGNLVEARDYLNKGIVSAKKGNLQLFFRFLFDSLAYHASGRDPRRAAQLFGAAEKLRKHLGIQLFPVERDEYEKYFTLAHSQLDTASWSAAWKKGFAMTLEQALELALSDG